MQSHPGMNQNLYTAIRVVLGAFALLLTASCAPDSDPPHLVIILMDDMGYGDPGCYNPDSKIPTPHIDRLAHEGMRFRDAHAAGALCHPSRYGLMTGRYPFRADLSVWRKHPTIEADRPTLPSILRNGGYHTAMIGKWHLGFDEKGYDEPLSGGPADRGFDQYFGIRASTDIPPYFYIRGDRAVQAPTDTIEASFSPGWSPIQGAFWRKGAIAPDLKLGDVLPRLTDEAIAIIKDYSEQPRKGKPLMLYLAYPAPHTPWLPSPEFVRKSGAGMYGDFLMMVDDQIGKVTGALKEAGMWEHTLLLFSSDNGPVWYDADVVRFGHDAAGGLRGMKGDAWEAGHRVPFIVRWPGKVQAGSISDQTICFTDVLATFSEVAGAELPEGAGPDSHSFYEVLLGRQPAPEPVRPPIVMQSAYGAYLIRSGPWKLIDRLGSGGFSEPGLCTPGPNEPEGQLYHLEEDPGERVNLYQDRPEVVEMLLNKLSKILENQ